MKLGKLMIPEKCYNCCSKDIKIHKPFFIHLRKKCPFWSCGVCGYGGTLAREVLAF